MNQLNLLFNRMWAQYTANNEQAAKIHKLLESRGEQVVNDHVALRTFGLAEVGIHVVAHTFVKNGYKPQDTYDFPKKKLRAQYFKHPDPKKPKVFISELKVEAFSRKVQGIIKNLVRAIPDAELSRWDLPIMGVPWPMISHRAYERLRQESEYAAWLSAFGFCANHFTVSINHLDTFGGIKDLNLFMENQGFVLNGLGGTIKGGPELLLEQSSTMASRVDVNFTDGVHQIPYCYYEFAKRYETEEGKLFHGFIAASANKIFESTQNTQAG